MNRIAFYLLTLGMFCALSPQANERWDLAKKHADTFRFDTLFTAQNVRDFLSSEEGLEEAVAWCRDTAVTRVFLETFRGGYFAEKETLQKAKRRFEEAGIEVSGCVTTTNLGRDSVNGWIFPCFTEQKSLETLRRSFEFSASLFDVVMIDDFFATGCECEDCKEAKGDRPWDEFRCEMMVDVSREYVIEPAREVNPDVHIIIKYPQWYDNFHNRGYEVVRQTEMFDEIWVGTETRDPDSERWGRKPQYEAFFIMRWLGHIGGEKCGGGWFDPYGTSPKTYVEQARQTILGGAPETVLFCYGSLLQDNGPDNVALLREQIPALFQLASMIQDKQLYGISAPKIPNSDPGGDSIVYDFIGMLGLPLVPDDRIRTSVDSLFLTYHSFKDPKIESKITTLLEEEKPFLITHHLAHELPSSLRDEIEESMRLEIPEDKWDLMDLSEERLQAIRDRLLQPFGIEFKAPTRVALYPFSDGIYVVENFNDREAQVSLRVPGDALLSVELVIPQEEITLEQEDGTTMVSLPARSLIVLKP